MKCPKCKLHMVECWRARNRTDYYWCIRCDKEILKLKKEAK